MHAHVGRATIWVVSSPANDLEIEKVWASGVGEVTRYDPQSFDDLIGDIDLHHHDWRELEVFGLDRTQALSVLQPYGGEFTKVFDDWFAFTRPEG